CEVPNDGIVERRLHPCRYALAECESNSHQRRLDQDCRTNQRERFLFTQTQRAAAAPVLRKLPGGPVDSDDDKQQSEEVVPRPACMAGALDSRDLSENVGSDGIAFARDYLVTL